MKHNNLRRKKKFAKRTIDTLIKNYIKCDQTKYILELIEYNLEVYEGLGFDMTSSRNKYQNLEKLIEDKLI